MREIYSEKEQSIIETIFEGKTYTCMSKEDFRKSILLRKTILSKYILYKKKNLELRKSSLDKATYLLINLCKYLIKHHGEVVI